MTRCWGTFEFLDGQEQCTDVIVLSYYFIFIYSYSVHSVLRWYRTLIHLNIHTKAQMLSAWSCNQVIGWTETWHLCYCAFLFYSLFIFSSGIVNKILSQIGGRLYLHNISIEGGIVHPDVHSLFDGPSQAVFFSTNDFKVLHRCFMATATLMYKYWGLGLQVFFKSFTKGSSWLSYVFFIAVDFSTTVAVNNTVLIGHSILILWWHQDVLECLTSLQNIQLLHVFCKCSWYSHICPVCRVLQCGIFLAECFDVGVSFFSFLCCFLKIFLIVHLRYLHWPSTSSKCCNSFSISFRVEQMVYALCVLGCW